MKNLLEGAPNARDLGGIKTLDGATLSHGKLIRSGVLNALSADDEKTLIGLRLQTVVDFRTDGERAQKPDRSIDGVSYVHCPIVEARMEGISRDKPETEDEEAMRTVKMAKRLMPRNPDGRAQMRSLYPILVGTPFAMAHYKSFFSELLSERDGALLYHCTMGKDRVGVGTALLLSALNVHRDDIFEDYLLTNERCAAGTLRLLESCRRYADSQAELDFIYELDRVDESYLAAAFETAKELYGSMAGYLKNAMGLDTAAAERLRELYLV